MIIKEKTCCFIGHRKIDITDELINMLETHIEYLISEKNINTFLFGSKSDFDKLCLNIVTRLKEKYSYIKRIYIRAEYPFIDESYTAFLLKKYEYTYFPKRLLNAGKARYIERNYEMIDNSSYCIIYYNENYVPKERKTNITNSHLVSGTKLAFNYAKRKKLNIINLYN